MKTLILLACVLGGALAHRAYRDLIPNGRFVPNPCKPWRTWSGVGHVSSAGGKTDRNQFGLDFKDVGEKSWTVELCRMDSDGDGQSNGQELGDPECTWTLGKTPDQPARGHPGICEPIGSTTCPSIDPC